MTMHCEQPCIYLSTSAFQMSSLAQSTTTTLPTRIVFGRILFLSVYGLSLLLAIISIPARYANLASPYAGEQYDFLRLTVRDLPLIGLSPQTYAAIALASELLWVSIPFAIAALIFWRRPNEWFPLFSGLVLVTFSVTTIYLLDALKPSLPLMEIAENGLQSFSLAGLVLFLYLFPNGRFAPGWLRIFAFIWVGLNIAWLFFPMMPGNMLHEAAAWESPIFGYLLGAGVFGSGVFSQIYRFRYVSTETERQQTKWIVFGLIIFYLGFTLRSYFYGQDQLGGVWQVGLIWVGSWMMIALSVSFGLALLRYRLWDIDLFLSRAFVYGSLMALLLVVYLGVISGMQTWFNSSSPIANFAATILVAGLIQPLRDGLQRLAARYLFGDRDDPMRVLGELGQRLEVVGDSAEILPTIVDSIASSLRVPWVAIALREGNGHTIAAEHGTPSAKPLVLPLTYQGDLVGELRVEPRTAADSFNERDLDLLQSVARQAGTAVNAVQLTHDLRRSRQHIVTAREEERRRLRRDLHDGLGPTLAAQVFRIGAARQLIERDPVKADQLLENLEMGMEETLADIRRLVYALRPPSLDQLGLTGAIRDYVRKYDTQFAIDLSLPEKLPAISAASEVAVFRIVQTALDNVAQHAGAACCELTLSIVGSDLILEIADDGVGISAEYQAGVGLTSMRERAEEPGGTFTIRPMQPNGTYLMARLPYIV